MKKTLIDGLRIAGFVLALVQTGLAVEKFEYDAIRNDGLFGKPWSWLSLPGSRLVLNPYDKIVNGVPPPLTNLRMDLGYFGTGCKKAEHLEEALTFRIEGADLSPRLTWMPHALQLDAVCEAKKMQVTATDFFADEHTVLRLAVVKGESGLAARVWSGRYSGKATQPEPGVVVIEADRYYCAASVVGVSPETDRATPYPLLIKDGQWSVRLPASESKQESVGVALAFAAKTEGVQGDVVVQRVKECLQKQSAAERLAGRKAAWRALLGKVPHVRFGIPEECVSPELHRFYYYGAYSFVLSHLMNPLPGRRYPYYSFAEGKPSLWAEGDPLEPAQCSWTCFIVCALMAPIYPEESWSSYEGIMSRVNEAGILGGECLPSRKAQGGWLLYSATGDRDRLKRVYRRVYDLITTYQPDFVDSDDFGLPWGDAYASKLAAHYYNRTATAHGGRPDAVWCGRGGNGKGVLVNLCIRVLRKPVSMMPFIFPASFTPCRAFHPLCFVGCGQFEASDV